MNEIYKQLSEAAKVHAFLSECFCAMTKGLSQRQLDQMEKDAQFVDGRHCYAPEMYNDLCCHVQALVSEVERLRNPRWKCIGCGAEFPRDDLDDIADVKYCSQCAIAQNRLGRIKELWSALSRIADERNEFEGPSLDYMQGYRDGQEHLAKIAREVL